MNIRKLSALVILGALLAAAPSWAEYKTQLTLVLGANGSIAGESYLLTVPDSLKITVNGWNSIGNITVSKDGDNTFDSAKQLVVTAVSSNDKEGGTFALKSGSDSINYIIKAASTDTEATTTWTFTADEVNSAGASKPIGILITWDSTQAAGTYEDYIVYTANVEDATSSLLSLSISTSDSKTTYTIYYANDETWKEAIDNHPADNIGWSYDQLNRVFYNNFALVDLSNAQVVGCDSTIDSSRTYVINVGS